MKPATTREDDRLTRLFVVVPLMIGIGLLAAAVVWTLLSEDLGLFGFLLMIIGGWCFGFAFVNVTMDIQPARLGALLHIVVAVVLGAVMIIMIETHPDLDGLPEPVRAVILVLQIAAAPGIGWIWLGLLSRVSDLFSRLSTKSRRPAPVAPDWEREERGDGSGVAFAAIEMRMRALTMSIIGIVVVVGVLGVALLIAFDRTVMQIGPRVAIVLMGVVLGLPAYLVFIRSVRRRQLACEVAFGNDELRIRTGDATHVIPYRELEFLLWRSRSDYARIEVRGAGVDLSLMTGLAKPAAGRTAELPPLPRRVLRRLEIAGMTLEKSRRDDVITFRRVAEDDARG